MGKNLAGWSGIFGRRRKSEGSAVGGGRKLLVGVAEVGAGLMAFAGGAFLPLVLLDFFFGVGEVAAGGEHAVVAAGFGFLFADTAELIADLAKRHGDGVDFKEEVADLFEEIVEMEGAGDVGQVGFLQRFHVGAAGHFGNDIEDADAAAFFGGNGGELAQSEESLAVCAGYGYVGDDQGPFSVAQLGKEEIRVGDDVYAPALGIEELADGGGVLGVLFENENAHLAGLLLRRLVGGAFHTLIIAAGEIKQFCGSTGAAYRPMKALLTGD